MKRKDFMKVSRGLIFLMSRWEGDHPFAMQEQTKLLVDGFMVPEKNMDVRALYQTDEMGK